MAQHENLEERLLHRLLFFTDAVFAIVMTLLVLELRPPSGLPAGVWAALSAMIGHLVAFGLSFAIAGVYWLAHLNSTRQLARFDWPTAVTNVAALLPVCLIPFVSAWVGEGYGSAAAWTAYSVTMVAISLGGVALILVETRDGGRLMAGGVTRWDRLHRVARAAIPGVAFSIGLIGLAAGQLAVGQLSWIVAPVLGVLLRTVLRPKPQAQGA